MTLHKLTAGDGYTYLTRQVAAHDATNRGYDSLGSYYSEKGEAPGVWMGRGLDAGPAAVPHFPSVEVGERVSEEQMLALFGEGLHPNAAAIERDALASGATPFEADRASRLGRRFAVHQQRSSFHRRSAGAFRDYNIARGLAPDSPVPAPERARMRTELATAMFREQYGRRPAGARELSGHLARISRQATTAVAGYDLSFSPVKSVSTLWAIAPRGIAEQIERAHHDAVTDTLTWLEDNAAYTRTGAAGVAQVEVRGLIAAAFTHRDSRAGDPDLHTHLAVSNKVQTLEGQWLALDGRALYKNNVAASERYNTRVEALLIDRLGLEFADRPGDLPGKRPVREIVGIDGDLPRAWSSRRAAIVARHAMLSTKFQAEHGRPPTPKEAVALAAQANSETRQRKHEPRSYAQQRATWRADALAVLGGGGDQAEPRLRSYIAGALRPGHGPRGARPEPQESTRAWVERSAERVLDVVQSARATWQINHVRAEAERQARAAGIRHGDLDRAVDAVVAEALSAPHSLPLDGSQHAREPVEPSKLRRSDGTSVYTVAGSRLFTSAEIIAAEKGIVAAAGRRDGRTVTPAAVDLALLESAANDVNLNPGQAQLVRELVTSGARVQLALAPAGTGKTTAMRVLSRVWTDSGGTVVGLAPSAAAATVLREEIGADTDTLAKLIHSLQTGTGFPEWLKTIGAKSLVVIDEAGMAGTLELAAATSYIVERGGSVRLVGDDQQLAAVNAGGVLRDIADVHGAVSLSQVMRFTNPPGHPAAGAPNHAEGAASLALREGDPAAIAYYLDNGRVHVGDLARATDDAYAAWSADRAAGRDAVMLAPTRDLVAELNGRARTERLAAQLHPTGMEAHLADGCCASAGDTIITRRNDRTIAITATDWVKNGDRWRIERVHESGALDVTFILPGERTRRLMTLPAGYVGEHVTLGYAATVHAAQGITADCCHTVTTGDETRQLLYVAMTRGRFANHVYLATAGDGDPHSIITRDALLPPTAGDILARVLARDRSPISATSQQRGIDDPVRQLGAAAARYHHALVTAAVDHLGVDALTDIDAAADAVVPDVTGQSAYPTLRAHLALLTVDGHDPRAALHVASRCRELDSAHDKAAVLDWRLDPSGRRHPGTGPLPWLPAVPDALAADSEWADYLRDRSELVSDLAGDVAALTRAWDPTSAPRWAASIIDHDPDLIAELAVWRAAHDVEDADRRPTGGARLAADEARVQRGLDARVARVLGDPTATTTRWAQLAARIDVRIADDPYWATLAERLNAADRAGIDIATLALAVGSQAPLPDEQPAAALWWRLSRHLSPAATAATGHSAEDTLRPDWTSTLNDVVGEGSAARIVADPAWPALVAAVTHAERRGWRPGQILSTAHDLLHTNPTDNQLRPEEYTTALVWQIAMLNDTGADDPVTAADGIDIPPFPDDARELVTQTPSDLDTLPDSVGPDRDADEDWVASLLADERGADPAEHDVDLGTLNSGHSRVADPLGEISAALDAAEHARDEARELEECLWASAAVSRERLLELNDTAADFFTAHYADVWASDYMTERLGPDLANDARFARYQAGYAPNTWTALTDHLRGRGVTDEEIVAAGLGVRASTGRIIDRFRDRLVFPITADRHDGHGHAVVEIHGFIARRNPTKTDDKNAGPKYLNTADTALFSKGKELFGLAEGRTALDRGATPVLVEGPLDAIAVTLAGDNQFVGVATLGTAFTDHQADALHPYISAHKSGDATPSPTVAGGAQSPIIVATDADRAGQQAAYRAFWQLAAHGEDPAYLHVVGGKDPAELFQSEGPAALRSALEDVGNLADVVIAARTAPFADRLDTIEGRLDALRVAADVVGALPVTTWMRRCNDLASTLGVAASTAINEVITAGQAWTDNPRGLARHRLAERVPDPTPVRPTQSDPITQWSEIVGTINDSITTDPHWPVLAQHLSRAAEHGCDVPARLALLVAQRPLSDRHAARDLDLRLISDWPGCLPQTGADTRRAELARTAANAQERTATADGLTANGHLYGNSSIHRVPLATQRNVERPTELHRPSAPKQTTHQQRHQR